MGTDIHINAPESYTSSRRLGIADNRPTLECRACRRSYSVREREVRMERVVTRY